MAIDYDSIYSVRLNKTYDENGNFTFSWISKSKTGTAEHSAFLEGNVRDYPESIQAQLMCHGLMQKLGDAPASITKPGQKVGLRERTQIILECNQWMLDGHWNNPNNRRGLSQEERNRKMAERETDRLVTVLKAIPADQTAVRNAVMETFLTSLDSEVRKLVKQNMM